MLMAYLQMNWQPNLLSHRRKTGPPLGIEKIVNACYINSVLQCLTSMPPLGYFCFKSKHSDSYEMLDTNISTKLKSLTEELRPYFSLPRVIDGLFNLVNMLFGINLEPADGLASVWNHDVRFYLVNDSFRIPIAYFYFDPYFHPSKKFGVWDKPSLMTFREVENVFHEFGHALQHMLTKQDEGLVAAIRGIEWDAMELPSQVMQNWCYHRYDDVFAMILEPFNLVAHLYCHCSSVYMYLALNCSHDVIGVVQSISPTISTWRKSNNETVPKRDITIVDETKKTVVVSLWNDVATNVGQELLDMADKSPVVAIKSLKVRLSRLLFVTFTFGFHHMGFEFVNIYGCQMVSTFHNNAATLPKVFDRECPRD
ncbi:hypothetical protein CQW23_21721 [Capsicum baccatum]|uniref:Uncharacterized protein n=1 Tax=Capsicum baccatum TaxID=33114 RepID=A0A2G2VYU8_CAPBA|nr:hypothetical protein CQW23_21721 [Capsicum baccatum]